MEAGHYVDKRDKQTRAVRWEQLDEDLEYDPNQLDRDVVAPDQIRTVVRTFRDRLFTEIFPGRTEVPKTLVFAKDDSHAEDIVEIIRQEFGKGNEFCKKITYRTTGEKPEDLIASFRNSLQPAHRRDGGYDLDRHRYQAAGVPALPAHDPFAGLFRADEGPRHARHLRIPICRRSRRMPGTSPIL